MGQVVNLRRIVNPIVNPPGAGIRWNSKRRVANPPQVNNLPHIKSFFDPA
jgi:hypothetical protein